MSSPKDAEAERLCAPGMRGILSIWIISMLGRRDMSGYGMLKLIAGATGHSWEPKAGSLYPALHKLRNGGLIKASKAGARGRIVYRLTPKGRNTAKKLRESLRAMHRTHKFRHMFEMLLWPDESDGVRVQTDSLFDALTALRSGRLSDVEKTRRLRAAASALK